MSADLVTDKAHFLVQPRAIVGLSHWLPHTYMQTHRNDRVLAVVTRSGSVLTLAAARFINDARTCWIVDHPDGTYDGFSGLCAHWDGLSFTYDGGLYPTYLDIKIGDDRAISVNAETTRSYSDDPQLGIFSVQILAATGCAPPTRFGIVESLCDDFSPRLVTGHARKLPPQNSLSIFSGGDGDGLIVSIPQPVGVTECLEFSGPCHRELTPDFIDHYLLHAPDAGAIYALIDHRLGPQGRMATPRCLHEVASLGLAVPEATLPYTTLDILVTKLRDQGVGEVDIIDSTSRSLGVRFPYEDATFLDLVSRRRTVLKAVLPPETVESIRPWYQQDTRPRGVPDMAPTWTAPCP